MNIESNVFRKSFVSRCLKVYYTCSIHVPIYTHLGTKIVPLWIISTTADFLRSRNLFV